MATKRKHETLSLATKMEILCKIDNGANQKALAIEYNVGRSTIYDINKNRKRIEHFVNVADSGTTSRQTLKAGKYRRMEDVLYAWFLEEHSKTKLTGDIIKQKALEIHEKMYKMTEFKASDGWLLKFKARYGINSLTNGENATEKIKNKDFKTPYLVPEETNLNSAETISTNKETNNDPLQSCEVIWVKDEVTLSNKKKLVKNEHALAAVDISIRWAEENNETLETLITLKKLKDKIINKISLENETEIKRLADKMASSSFSGSLTS